MHADRANCPANRYHLTLRKSTANDDGTAAAEQTQRTEPRRDPLVAAMMEALKGLMPAASNPPAATAATPDTTAAAAATTTDAAAPASTETATAPAAATLQDAALAFAHALYGALRGAGESSDGGERQGHRRHGHHHRGGGRDYGDLPQQLEALAQQIAGPTAAAATATTTAAATSSTTAAVTAASTATTTSTDGATAAVATKPENPLVAAFRQLFEALNAKKDVPATEKSDTEATDTNDSTANSTAGTTATSAAPDAKAPTAAEQLAAFLRQLAQSRAARSDAQTAAPATGSLINVAA